MSTLFIILFSIIGLIWGANHLITSATGIAQYYRVPPLIIGLTIVAIASSAPEIIVGLASALKDQNPIALGNALGSNIANIGLILGIILLIRPLTLQSSLLKREYPVIFIVMLFTYSLMLDGYLGVMDGCLFLMALILTIGYLIYLAKQSAKDVFAKEFNMIYKSKRSMVLNITGILFGGVLLAISAHFLVEYAAIIALRFGMSELTTGLTVIAIGTSLPQLATSLIATFKKQDDIAVGNILGSNIFNLLIVLIFPAIINPQAISRVVLWRDLPVMFAVTAILLWINYQKKTKISRWHGGLLLLIYGCYVTAILLNAGLGDILPDAA